MSISRLSELADLKDRGAITEAEYEAHKERILTSLGNGPRRRWGKLAAIAGGLAVLVAGGWAYASPYWTMHQIRSAAASGDTDTLSDYIDIDAVRSSFKEQLSAEMLKAGQEPTEEADGFEALGKFFAIGMVDTLVTRTMVSQGMVERYAEAGQDADPVLSYTGFSSFSAKTSYGTMDLQRDGLGWMVVSLKVKDPGALFSKDHSAEGAEKGNSIEEAAAINAQSEFAAEPDDGNGCGGKWGGILLDREMGVGIEVKEDGTYLMQFSDFGSETGTYSWPNIENAISGDGETSFSLVCDGGQAVLNFPDGIGEVTMIRYSGDFFDFLTQNGLDVYDGE